MKIPSLALLMMLFSSSAWALNLSTVPTHLMKIIVEPNPAVMRRLHITQRFTAYGWYSHGGWSVISRSCVWDTSNHSIATVDRSGIVTSVAYGGPIEVTCTGP